MFFDPKVIEGMVLKVTTAAVVWLVVDLNHWIAAMRRNCLPLVGGSS